MAGVLLGTPAAARNWDYFDYEVRWDACPSDLHNYKVWWAPTGSGEVKFIVCEWITVSDDPQQPVGKIRYRWKK